MSDMRGGICCCYDGDSTRCPIHQTDIDAAELIGIVNGLDDVANTKEGGDERRENDVAAEN